MCKKHVEPDERIRLLFSGKIVVKERGKVLNAMKKKRFAVAEGETIAACLERMKQEGYRPIRRIEKPIFREVETNGETTVEPYGRIIEFEAVRDEP
jgi:hypothetical protein